MEGLAKGLLGLLYDCNVTLREHGKAGYDYGYVAMCYECMLSIFTSSVLSNGGHVLIC